MIDETARSCGFCDDFCNSSHVKNSDLIDLILYVYLQAGATGCVGFRSAEIVPNVRSAVKKCTVQVQRKVSVGL